MTLCLYLYFLSCRVISNIICIIRFSSSFYDHFLVNGLNSDTSEEAYPNLFLKIFTLSIQGTEIIKIIEVNGANFAAIFLGHEMEVSQSPEEKTKEITITKEVSKCDLNYPRIG